MLRTWNHKGGTMRSEKLMLIRETPPAIVEVLDSILGVQGYARAATRALTEDFTPLLHEQGEPLAFVLSSPRDEWVACFSSLAPTAEWELAEALAAGLEQPLVYVLLQPERDLYLYRRFEDGNLREEALPDAELSARLDEAAVLEKLRDHDVPVELLDDRTSAFGEEHLVLGYSRVA
jgi:hypothetical protein